MSLKSALKEALFDGNPVKAPDYIARLRVDMAAEGIKLHAITCAVDNKGPFKDMTYETASRVTSAEDSTKWSLFFGSPGLTSPKSRLTAGDVTPSSDLKVKMKSNSPPKEEDFAHLYIKIAQTAYRIIMKTCTMPVRTQLKTLGMREGQGIKGIRLIKQEYLIGGKAAIVPNFRSLVRLRQGGNGIIEHNDKFKQLVTFLDDTGFPINDQLAALLYLDSLGDFYDKLRKTIFDESRNELPHLQPVIARVLHNTPMEMRRIDGEGARARANAAGQLSNDGQDGKANKTTWKPPSERMMRCTNCDTMHVGGEWTCKAPCKTCGSDKHVRFHCPNKNKGGKKGKKNPEEKKPTATAAYMPDWNAARSAANKNSSEYSRYAATTCSLAEDTGSCAHSHSTTAARDAASHEPNPLADGGCSDHMFSEASTPAEQIEPISGDTRLDTAGGTLKIVGKTSYIPELPNALVVRGLRRQLVSITKLCDDRDKSYTHTKDGIYEIDCKFNQFVKEVGKKIAIRRNNLYEYMMKTEGKERAAHVADMKSLAVAIHERFGHRPVVKIIKAVRKGRVKLPKIQKLNEADLKNLTDEARKIECVECGLGKMTRLPARRRKPDPDLRVGDIFYADACVPVKPFVQKYGIGMVTGWLLVVDKKSRYCFQRDISDKGASGDALHDILKPLVPALPKSTKHAQLRYVVPDSCQSLKSKSSINKMESLGFFLDPTAGYHKNSLAPLDERMRMITETTRTMLQDKDIPVEEHVYAKDYATEIVNRMPMNDGKSPYEKFWGKVPDLSRMQKFYSSVYVKLIDGAERRKSERYSAVAYIGKYLGLAPRGRGHLIRRPGHTKPIIRHDVIFKNELPRKYRLGPMPDSKEKEPDAARFAPHSLDGFLETIEDEKPPPVREISYDEPRTNTLNTIEEGDEKLPDESEEMAGSKPTRRRIIFEDEEQLNEKPEPKKPNGHEVEYEVAQIIDDRKRNNLTEYLVDWKGEYKPSWEPEENLSCDELLKEYHSKHESPPEEDDEHDTPQSYSTSKTSSLSPTYGQAMKSPEAEEWKEVIQAEYKNFNGHDSFIPRRSTGKEKITNTILTLRTKLKSDGSIDKRKARLCLDGRRQVKGVDFFESFAPVVLMEVLRLCLCLGISSGMKMMSFDFTGAFLNAEGDKRTRVYIRPPPGYVMPKGFEDCDILELKKAMYGSKDSGSLWYKLLKSDLESQGFIECPSAKCLFIRPGKRPTIIFVHVDDGVILHNDQVIIDDTLERINTRLKLTKAPLTWHLGVKMEETKNYFKMSIPSYIEQLADRFGLSDANDKKTPMNPSATFIKNTGNAHNCPYQEAIGALLWASRVCRPDISFAVAKLSQFTSCPSKAHWSAVKRVIQYLKATKDKGLRYRKPETTADLATILRQAKLEMFSDSDYATDPNNRKSQSGYIIYLLGCVIDWGSHKQPVVAQSTCEAEMIAGVRAMKKGRYLQKVMDEISSILQHGKDFMKHLIDKPKTSITLVPKKKILYELNMDNAAAVTVSETGNFQKRLKHMDVRYYYINEEFEKKNLKINRIPSEENPADLFTKPVSVQTFNRLVGRLVW